MKVAAELVSQNLGSVGLLADAVVELLLDQGPQGLPVGICFGSHLRHFVVELDRDRSSSFVYRLGAAIEPLPEPANLSVNAVAQRAKGSKGQFLEPLQRLAKLLPETASLVLDGGANDVGFGPLRIWVAPGAVSAPGKCWVRRKQRIANTAATPAPAAAITSKTSSADIAGSFPKENQHHCERKMNTRQLRDVVAMSWWWINPLLSALIRKVAFPYQCRGSVLLPSGR